MGAIMNETTVVKKSLPPGWRVIDNSNFVSPLHTGASAFADRVLVEYKKLFGLYTKSEDQVVVMEDVPDEDTLTRARSILHERGYRCLVNWVQVIKGIRIARLDVFEYKGDGVEPDGTGKTKGVLSGFIRFE
jgi:hypothetical protein